MAVYLFFYSSSNLFCPSNLSYPNQIFCDLLKLEVPDVLQDLFSHLIKIMRLFVPPDYTILSLVEIVYFVLQLLPLLFEILLYTLHIF